MLSEDFKLPFKLPTLNIDYLTQFPDIFCYGYCPDIGCTLDFFLQYTDHIPLAVNTVYCKKQSMFSAGSLKGS